MEIFETKATKSYQKKLETYIKNQLPILVLGEEGTGKTTSLISISEEKNGHYWDSRFVFSEKEKFLKALSKHSEENTILCLDNVDFFSSELTWELQKILSDTKAKWIFSTTSPLDIEDLKTSKDFFRSISLQSVRLPNLREQNQELPMLFYNCLQLYCQKYKKKSKSIHPELGNFLLRHDFSRNWIELHSITEALVLFSKKSEVTLKDLPEEIFHIHSKTLQRKLQILPGLSMDEYEKEILKVNLALFSGNREKTAKSLGISERNLYRKILQYNLP